MAQTIANEILVIDSRDGIGTDRIMMSPEMGIFVIHQVGFSVEVVNYDPREYPMWVDNAVYAAQVR